MWTTQNSDKNSNNKSANGNTVTNLELVEERKALTDQTDNLKSHCFTVNPDSDDDMSDTVCGLGPCAPSWLQKFASKQIFLAVFCVAWVLQGMYHTYFVSAITTIEKLFQIQSKITGIIMSATEIGQIGSSLLLTYYGGQGHRPKWIAWGMVLFAVSSFTCSLPHFIYGKQIMNSDGLTGSSNEPDTCKLFNASMYDDPFYNATSNKMDYESMEPRIEPTVTKIVLAIFFISLLGVGMGQTAVYTLGIPYMDDNVASRESPLYFAITIGVRILGPALGFIVGSLCTSLYADLSIHPNIDANHPRWVGAWWLGLVMISGLLMLTSFAMFSFPKRLSSGKRAPPKVQGTGRKHPSIRDFPKTVKRLLKNDVLMFRTASSVLHILPIAGLYTFLPKYLESQFRLPTPSANMISGVGGILVMGLGIIASGIVILKFKPSARCVAAWIAFTAALYAVGMGMLMFVGCPMNLLLGYGEAQPICDTTPCNCNPDKIAPICGADGRTYYSACHAGCGDFTKLDEKIVGYVDCVCLQDTLNTTFDNAQAKFGSATVGYCDTDCSNFLLYIVLFSLFVFIHSTSEVGSMLLILRCVETRDKAMALGLIQFAIGLFGNVPCPIVYGAVVDYACLDWKMVDGEKGACKLYDSNIFRMFYHGTTGAILLCAFIVDIIVFYKAGSITFVDEEEPLEEEMAAITLKPRND